MEGDTGCKEDDQDRRSIAQSGDDEAGCSVAVTAAKNPEKEDEDSQDDKASCSVTVNGARNPENEDEEGDKGSVPLKDQVFPDFYDSFMKNSRSPTLGLKLAITSQLLDQINTALSVEQENCHSASASVNFASTSRGNSAPQSPLKMLKAANFLAKELIIGSWKRIADVTTYLVVKIYFAKRKLIWEIMCNQLMKKIEIQWADIAAIKAYSQDDGTEVLEVELSRPPKFFCEAESDPRLQSKWKATQDFTAGEALKYRRHKVICAPGAHFKRFTRLLQCDDRLYNLRSHDVPSLHSTSFESGHSGDQFQKISPSDHSKRPPAIDSELSIQQTTTLPLQVSDGCINVQAGENPTIVYLESGMNNFPDSSQFGNSLGDYNVQCRNNRADSIQVMENSADDVQEMNNFGSNSQLMNLPTSFGNNNSGANYSHQGADGLPSISGYEYLDYQRHFSEWEESMEPSVNQCRRKPVSHHYGTALAGEIFRIRSDHVLQRGQNYAHNLQEMNNFGNNSQVMNPATSLGSNDLAANFSHQGAEGPTSSSGYEQIDYQRHSSERVESMKPSVNQYGRRNPVVDGASSGEISVIRSNQVLQPGQSSNGSGGLLYKQNVGIPHVIDPSILMSDFNPFQNGTPYNPSSANFNLGDRSENKKE
ncbi:hypothetical protein SLE2022_081040 [Rubroshorea leprosula]